MPFLETLIWGYSACISSVFGLYFRIKLRNSPDYTWNLAPVLATV